MIKYLNLITPSCLEWTFLSWRAWICKAWQPAFCTLFSLESYGGVCALLQARFSITLETVKGAELRFDYTYADYTSRVQWVHHDVLLVHMGIVHELHSVFHDSHLRDLLVSFLGSIERVVIRKAFILRLRRINLIFVEVHEVPVFIAQVLRSFIEVGISHDFVGSTWWSRSLGFSFGLILGPRVTLIFRHIFN